MNESTILAERSKTLEPMPRWPKPHIFKNGQAWMVRFTNPLYPHTRYNTGFLPTIKLAWKHLPVAKEFHGVP